MSLNKSSYTQNYIDFLSRDSRDTSLFRGYYNRTRSRAQNRDIYDTLPEKLRVNDTKPELYANPRSQSPSKLSPIILASKGRNSIEMRSKSPIDQSFSRKKTSLINGNIKSNIRGEGHYPGLKCKKHKQQVVGICMSKQCSDRMHCFMCAPQHEHVLERNQDIFNSDVLNNGESRFLNLVGSDFIGNELKVVEIAIENLFKKIKSDLDDRCEELIKGVRKNCYSNFGFEKVKLIKSMKISLLDTINSIKKGQNISDDELDQYFDNFRTLVDLSEAPIKFRSSNISLILKRLERLGGFLDDINSKINKEIRLLLKGQELYQPAFDGDDISKALVGLKNKDDHVFNELNLVDQDAGKPQEVKASTVYTEKFIAPIVKTSPNLDLMNLHVTQRMILEHQEQVVSVAFSPISNKLIVLTSRAIHSFSLETFQKIDSLEFLKKEPNRLVKCLSSHDLMVYTSGNMVEIRSIFKDFPIVFEFDVRKPIKCFDVAEHADLIALSAESSLFLVDYKRKMGAETPESCDIVAIMPNDNCIAMSDDTDLKILSLETRQIVCEFKSSHESLKDIKQYPITSIHYDVQRRLLYTCSSDIIKQWSFNLKSELLVAKASIQIESQTISSVISTFDENNILIFDDCHGLQIVNIRLRKVTKAISLGLKVQNIHKGLHLAYMDSYNKLKICLAKESIINMLEL